MNLKSTGKAGLIRNTGIFILGLVLVYILLRLSFFDNDPIVPFIAKIIDSYLVLTEKVATSLAGWYGKQITITGHKIINSAGEPVYSLDSGALMKKWMLFLIILTWITPVKSAKKILFTLIIIVSNFLFASINISLIPFFAVHDGDPLIARGISRTPGVLVMTGLMWIWIIKHREKYYRIFEKMEINTGLIRRRLKDVIIISFLYAILSNFILGYFEFTPWIEVLFGMSQRILSLAGTGSTVDVPYLLGDNGAIYMAKGCLGFRTILLFASIVYLTGKSRKRWLYIFVGFILLNLVNVFRFVFLFMHIQRHGGYTLLMDVHDMYNYIIYTFVFILWIIWFEFFADEEPIRKTTVKTA